MRARRGAVPATLPNVPFMALRVLATILSRARDNAARHLSNAWTEGVTMYGVGSVGYELSAVAIKRAANSGRFPWLKLVSIAPELVFTIHGVPFKFFRGDDEHKASLRHATPSLHEAARTDPEQLEMLDGAAYDPGVNRLIIDTTPRGFPAGVIYARVTADRVLHDKTPIPVLMFSAVDVAFEVEALSITDVRPETMKRVKPRRKNRQDPATGSEGA
jgi:hypothetical protein